VNCPWCAHESGPRALHAHLHDEHADKVVVTDDESGRNYQIECPQCGAGYTQPIKPRLRDSGFVDEFEREIRLVAFDMLINHLVAEHEDREVALPEIRPHGGTP
jgi:peptide subunit release factor 1 (eRF1)